MLGTLFYFIFLRQGCILLVAEVRVLFVSVRCEYAPLGAAAGALLFTVHSEGYVG